MSGFMQVGQIFLTSAYQAPLPFQYVQMHDLLYNLYGSEFLLGSLTEYDRPTHIALRGFSLRRLHSTLAIWQ